MFSVFASLLIGSAQAESRPAETGVMVEPQIVVDLAEDHPEENLMEAYTRVRAWAQIPTERGRWLFEARGQQALQARGFDIRSEELESTWEVSLGETAWEGGLGPTWLELGNRVERWGRQDLLGIVDVLNGRDLRAGPLTPPELLKIPTPMATIGRV